MVPTRPHVEDLQVNTLGSSGDATTAIGHTNVATAASTTVEWTLGATTRPMLIVVAFAPAPAGPILKTASDTLSVAVGDGAPAILAVLAVADALGLSLGEALDLRANLVAGDSLSLSVADSPLIQASLAASDVLGAALVETPTVLALLAAAEALSVTLGEAAAMQANVAGGDTVALSARETALVAAIAVASDVLTLSLGEAPALAATVAGCRCPEYRPGRGAGCAGQRPGGRCPRRRGCRGGGRRRRAGRRR